jgi:hypothetical protein
MCSICLFTYIPSIYIGSANLSDLTYGSFFVVSLVSLAVSQLWLLICVFPCSDLSLSNRPTLEACFLTTREEAHVTGDTIVDSVSIENSSLLMTKGIKIVDLVSLDTSSLITTKHITISLDCILTCDGK